MLCCLAKSLWREYAPVPVTRTYLMPDSMTYEEAAAIPVSYVTAYHMLFDFGNLRKGKSVLIHMVAGKDFALLTGLWQFSRILTAFSSTSTV